MIHSLKQAGIQVCQYSESVIASSQAIGFLGANAIVKLKIAHLNPLATAISFAAFRTFGLFTNRFDNDYINNSNLSDNQKYFYIKCEDILSGSMNFIYAAAIYASTSTLTQRTLIGINVAILSIAISLKLIAPK